MKTWIIVPLLLLVAHSFSLSQWSSNPAENLMVCDTTGEQVLPKVASTSNGGCYISWFDARSGNYSVYLQLLDASGVKMWGAGGLLISGNPQSSSLVDYDLIVDNLDNAVLVFTDIRTGGNLNVFAYMVEPDGALPWGASGVPLSVSTDFQANPKVAQTTDGNFVVTWVLASTPGKIAMQKLSPSGQKLWGDSPILIQGAGNESLSYPGLVASDSGHVIVMWTGNTGTFLNPFIRIYAQRFSTDGMPVWAAADTVQNLGRIAFFHVPQIISDGSGGAYISWPDDRNQDNLYSSFVQHVTASGTNVFPVNGSEVSTFSGRHHLSPATCALPASGDVFAFWSEKNSNQSQTGIYGQRFSSSGTRLWTDNGMMFRSLSAGGVFGPYCVAGESTMVVFFLEGDPSGLNDSLMAFKIDRNGTMLWGNPVVTLSGPTQEKLHTVVTMDVNGVAKAVWEDRRNGSGIYGQNLNQDGSLGTPPVAVRQGGHLPSLFHLEQNYPNPFNPSTSIGYSIPTTSRVSLEVYNILGQRVTVPVNEVQQAGRHEVYFETRTLASGVYFYRLRAGNSFVQTRKMLLLR